MPRKLKVLKLTDAELGMIKTWLLKNIDEGWYYAPANQYWNRCLSIKDKIDKAKGIKND